MARSTHEVQSTGRRIAAARKAAGLTQAELAERLGVKQGTVADYERDRFGELKVSTLKRLATALGVAAGDLLGD